MSEMGIYQIRNNINNKIYVGSSVDIPARWSAHKYRLNSKTHSNPHLQASWDKYREGVFEFSVVEIIDDVDNILVREQWYLDNWNPDYNIAIVAGNNQLGRPLSEEAKAKIRATKRKNRRKFSGKNNHFYGKTHTDETKKKISEYRSGKKLSKAHKEAIGKAERGEKSHYAKLSWDGVHEIRRLYEDENWSENMLIEKYNMSQSAINKIVRYKTWRE